eukprot:TRINITY_DN25778_c0_g1_i2.p1 TRINITY_DN25778_c0_g1~~TRINITY_DN25778_c0_g1_i2.p1  ORF type:complete len:443 (-),score=70.53 TRINITY_DN25778_c0_g1_i2:62-1390(-)
MPPTRRSLSAGGSGNGASSPAGTLEAMTVVALRARLRELDLPTSGNKAQLVARLNDHRSSASEAPSAAASAASLAPSDAIALASRATGRDQAAVMQRPAALAQPLSDGVQALVAMGFARELALNALAATAGVVADAAELLADASFQEAEPLRKRGRTSSAVSRSTSFASSSAWEARGSSVSRRRAPAYRRAAAGTDDRIERALSQRLYLLERRVGQDVGDTPQTTFMVMGSTGNVYEVLVGTSPCCSCPDFQRRQSPCKHILFVWIRVLRLDADDPRIWQKRLRVADVREVLERRRAPAVERGVHAPKDVKDRYKHTFGSQEPQEEEEAPATSGRLRKMLDEDDCPICYEAMDSQEEARGLITYCSCCGSNLHKDCMSRWQQASKNADCPICREPYRRPCVHTAPGSMIAAQTAPPARGLSRQGSLSAGYTNLLFDDEDDRW